MIESTYLIIFVGNPLLDMQVKDGEKLLEKYDLKVDEKHLAILVE
jgi:adenosine kinase